MRLAVALFAVGLASFLGAAVNVRKCEEQYALDVESAFHFEASGPISKALGRYRDAPTLKRFQAIRVEVENEMRKGPLYVDAKEVKKARNRYDNCLGGGYGTELLPLAPRSMAAPSCIAPDPLVKTRRYLSLPPPRVWNSEISKAPTFDDFERETRLYEQEWLDLQNQLDALLQ